MLSLVSDAVYCLINHNHSSAFTAFDTALLSVLSVILIVEVTVLTFSNFTAT